MLAVKRKEENYEIKVHSLLLDLVYQLVTHIKNKTSIRPTELNGITGYEFTEEEDYQELDKLL